MEIVILCVLYMFVWYHGCLPNILYFFCFASVGRMYVFGGWVPVPETDKPNTLGAEWICTNSLSVLNLGQYHTLSD
jgi:hypothetical protein